MCVYRPEKKIQLSWFLPEFYEKMYCMCTINMGVSLQVHLFFQKNVKRSQ